MPIFSITSIAPDMTRLSILKKPADARAKALHSRRAVARRLNTLLSRISARCERGPAATDATSRPACARVKARASCARLQMRLCSQRMRESHLALGIGPYVRLAPVTKRATMYLRAAHAATHRAWPFQPRREARYPRGNGNVEIGEGLRCARFRIWGVVSAALAKR